MPQPSWLSFASCSLIKRIKYKSMKQLSSEAERGGADKPGKCSPVTLNLYSLLSENKMSQGRQGWR